MKKAIFTCAWKTGEHMAEDVQSWVDMMIAKNSFGKPERWEQHETPPKNFLETREVEVSEATPERQIPEIDEEGNETGDLITIPAQAAKYATEYKMPSEYTYEVIDITEVYERNEIIKNRLKEYPNQIELIEALMEHLLEGRSEKINKLQEKRLAVKAKYPKK